MVPRRFKVKVYKTGVRSVMLHGAEYLIYILPIFFFTQVSIKVPVCVSLGDLFIFEKLLSVKPVVF